LREARAADVPAIDVLAAAHSVGGHTVSPSMAMLHRKKCNAVHIIVATNNDAVVGFTITWPHNRNGSVDRGIGDVGALSEVVELEATYREPGG
jgi:hypothetical protein